jgi:hypothetical protein
LLKESINTSAEFQKWVKSVHELLSTLSSGEQPIETDDDEVDSMSKKGLISRKAISTYLKQWELFSLEKLGPSFSIEVSEKDASPLTGKLNSLENGASRTWTTMIGDITEVRTSAFFQKRVSATTEHVSKSVTYKNIDTYDLQIDGRPLKIQMSSNVSEEMVTQFVKAMKAQFLAYPGKGLLDVSFKSGQGVITASLLNAVKSDLKKTEEMLLALR